MDQTGRARRILKASKAARYVKYRLRIAKAEENEVERLPLDVALQLERHLQQMAELAGESAETNPARTQQRDAESGLLRFELQGFCVLYEVDRATESVVVSSVKRVRPSPTAVAPRSV
jgi:mRNA-degrading endonuclease RelE of RelBE toxin-antitoxin system